MAVKKQVDLTFIDFIQLIKPSEYMHRWSGQQRVSYYSHELKRTAKATGTAIVALSQINRGGDPPPNIKLEDAWRYVPKLIHLKEAGALEEDADLVQILYNDPMKPNAEQHNIVPLVVDIAKNKKGPKGKVTLRYRKDRQRIEQKEPQD